MKLNINLKEKCNKSSDERSELKHMCLENLEVVRSDEKKNLLVILDFLTEKMVISKNYIAGNTGNILKRILGIFQDDFNIEITTAIKCFRKYDNTSVKAKDIQLAHKVLIKEIWQYKPDLIICFGEKAITTIFGKSQTIKDHRNKFVRSNNMVFSTTFSLLSVIMDPSKEKEILKDCYLINEKWNSKELPLETNYKVHDLEFSKVFALDIETTQLNPFLEGAEILTLAVSKKEGESFGLNIAHPKSKKSSDILIDYLKSEFLSIPDNIMIGHNIKFDALWLSAFGYPINCQLWDTKIAYILLDENSPTNTLKYLAANLTDLPTDYTIDTKNLKDQDFEKVILYNMQDADATYRVYKILAKELEEKGKNKLMSFLMSVLKVLLRIEYNGIKVDLRLMQEEMNVLKERIDELEAIFGMYNINPDSPKQLADLLYNKWGLHIINKTEKGSPATDTFTLEKKLLKVCKNEDINRFIKYVLEWRNVSKQYNTFYLGMQEYITKNGRVHTIYNLGKTSNYSQSSGTVTGRLSSNNPNLQNIPREGNVRKLFVADPGYKWLDVDYSQLEMRVAAWYAKENKLVQYFKDGKDFHTAVFSELLKRDYNELVNILKDKNHKEYSELKNKRVVIKSINFGILYGAGASMVKQLCDQADVKITQDECQEMINKWLSSYPKLKKWIEKTKKQALETGVVSSPTGRDRHLIGVGRGDTKSFALLRQAVNFPIQTLASEICLAALVLIQDWIDDAGLDIKIVLTVHDSIGLIFNEKYNQEDISKKIKFLMCQAVPQYFDIMFGFNFDVPLDVEINISDRWS